MARIRRLGATLALAGVLCTSLALTPTPLRAAPTVAPQVTEKVCAYLTEAIEFLEGKPPTRLSDFLLTTLRKAHERHCV